MEQLLGIGLFVLFALLWLVFGIALIASQGSLDAAWEWIRSLPLIAQAVVWVAFLPVVLGLWVWQTDWTLVVRVLVIAGIAIARSRGARTSAGDTGR
jgi:hypothetical protein